jgi:ADP-L-glycero-D-manno-heptose 6-epimerase
VYGYSKLLFDQRLRHLLGSKFENAKSQVVGFRYFNVYGNREQHKGRMASVAFHQFNQFKEHSHVKLFGEYGGYAAGMQQRDFVYIDDVVAVNLWFYDNPTVSGLFNLGTGRAQPFNDIAVAVVNTMYSIHHKQSLMPQSLDQLVNQKLIQYIPFPAALVGKYQCHTQADLTALRATGCDHVFADVNQGVSAYIQQLASK